MPSVGCSVPLRRWDLGYITALSSSILRQQKYAMQPLDQIVVRRDPRGVMKIIRQLIGHSGLNETEAEGSFMISEICCVEA
ncbi:uncharacterized protein N7483_007385 [Penicillium malachiteum]|uniref:uncharacterized protein n=1 Tax=Penicillium malachiteum TaxID=1324776 RepID=UPI0025481D1D|nr:uncharacterized protein N7483_007385 [Penicillium malachiteum]KAJ5726028.1 hypothetical protein N7483_007385 [Penicillium malachiteum]